MWDKYYLASKYSDIMELRKATKQKAKLRIGLAGTSGSGKTYSALKLARGMVKDWSEICVIDTENGSADLYASLGDYNVITLQAPFSPERYIEAIHAAESGGMKVIIVDSITHEWDGKGGCLEIVESLGGRYQDWSKVTPRHRKFIDAILQSPCHILTTVRRKQDYEMTKDQNGKLKVEKAGLKEITREGFEYELTLSFNLNMHHMADPSKDRTGMFMKADGSSIEFMIDETTGQKLLEWAEAGNKAPEKAVFDLAAATEKIEKFATLEICKEYWEELDTFDDTSDVVQAKELLKAKAEEIKTKEAKKAVKTNRSATSTV